MIFQADCDEIELQKNQLWPHFCDVIAITSAKWRHKIFLFWVLPIKISGYVSVLQLIIIWLKLQQTGYGSGCILNRFRSLRFRFQSHENFSPFFCYN